MCQDPRELRHLEAVHKEHALAHEDKEYIIPAAVQRFVVGLPFGDDNIGVCNRFPRLP